MWAASYGMPNDGIPLLEFVSLPEIIILFMFHLLNFRELQKFQKIPQFFLVIPLLHVFHCRLSTARTLPPGVVGVVAGCLQGTNGVIRR